jgi:hypothetical protein
MLLVTTARFSMDVAAADLERATRIGEKRIRLAERRIIISTAFEDKDKGKRFMAAR